MKFKETKFYQENKAHFAKRGKKGNAMYWAGAIAFLGGLYGMLRGQAISNYSKGIDKTLDATDEVILNLEYEKEEPIETTGETVNDEEDEEL